MFQVKQFYKIGNRRYIIREHPCYQITIPITILYFTNKKNNMQNSQAVLSVKFNSIHSSAELIQLFKQDLDLFKAVPGLVQKYYIAEEGTRAHGGIYVFENKAARNAFLNSDLASKIPSIYGVEPDTLRIEQFVVSIELSNTVPA